MLMVLVEGQIASKDDLMEKLTCYNIEQQFCSSDVVTCCCV